MVRAPTAKAGALAAAYPGLLSLPAGLLITVDGMKDL